MSDSHPSRRDFLKVGAAAGGGLLVSVTVPSAGWRFAAIAIPGAPGAPSSHALNAFVEIATDGEVIIYAPCPELGQGVRTSLPMIVADELGVDWSAVTYRQAPADERYGSMTVGGSDSVADYWAPLRLAGATARELLKEAASRRWGVARASLEVEAGRVTHGASGRSATFGELAAAAAELPAPDPEDVPLEDPGSFDLIGRPTGPVDASDIVRGAAEYGLDVSVAGMRFAAIERAPVHGGALIEFDATDALAVPGVTQVFEVEAIVPDGRYYGAVRSGVAVIAENTWAALEGRRALRARWDAGRHGSESSEAIRTRLRAAVSGPAADLLRDDGDVDAALERADRRIVAEYELPPLAHAPMEPMNFTADVRADGCRVWGPTQTPRALRQTLASVLGLPLESVEVRPTLSGGGFGRRLAYDYGVEAALVSRRLGGPVKVIWSREDDIRLDYFRTPSRHRIEAGLDGNGRVLAWRHHVASASLLHNTLAPSPDRERIPAAIFDIEGASDIAYDIPNVRVEHTPVELGLQMGSWRSVAHSFNVFVVNSFVDELAAATDADPLDLQLRLLGAPRVAEIDVGLPGRRGSPRPDTGLLRRVLEVAAREGGWGNPLRDGGGRGLGVSYYKRTYAAHVVELSVDAEGVVDVRRVVVAMDCGRVVNPAGAAAQAEGAVMDALGTALMWEVTVEDGRVREGNFDDYRIPTMADAPAIEVHLLPSDRDPSGAGEPPYPSAVPAITNAIFAATGRRVRRLPVRRVDLRG